MLILILLFFFSDGVFKIKPPGKHPVKTYCDFASYGGGWTLLATSKTHSGWNQNNVKHRNAGDPSLNGDFSILGVADAIKDFDPSQVNSEVIEHFSRTEGVKQKGRNINFYFNVVVNK